MNLGEVELEIKGSLNLRAVNDVLVNPETQRHVGIELQVKHRTTRDIGIAVPVTRCEADVTTTKENIGNDVINGVGGLSVNQS